MSQAKAPLAGGASTRHLIAVGASVAEERGQSESAGTSWALSPVRVAAVAAEQRALAGFEQIADTMPEVAVRLTTRLLPDRHALCGRSVQ